MCYVSLSMAHHLIFLAHKFLPSTFSIFSYLSLPPSLSHPDHMLATTLLGSINTPSLTKTCSIFFFHHLLLSLSTRISARMRNMSSLKQEFLQRWITGLRKYSSKKKDMNLLERKKVIKLSADLAMASTRDKTTHWSRALIANASRNSSGGDKVLPEQRLASSPQNNISSPLCRRNRIRSRKILIRRNRAVRRGKERVTASFIAKRLVKKRTRRLKSLLPGGELMDDACLVEETLDYIQSLRAQVEVMRCLVTASELIKNPP